MKNETMDEIPYPRKASEADVQYAVCDVLRQHGFDARLEVIARRNGHRHQFDIVVFQDKRAQTIIECKSYSKPSHMPSNHKQSLKYMEWGLPVFLCCRPENVPTVTRAVISYLQVKSQKILGDTYPTPLKR